MPGFELTAEEQQTLREILERYHPDIRREIANTDDREYRRHLKKKEAFMKDLLERLKKQMGSGL
ncbi:MAG TPA: hypothetical protein PK587_13925 [Syntrophales bacterium]|nr:hypothetical protein [Syntrophales bacterium]